MIAHRITWIDAAKFVGIFMVAFGHNWLDSKFCYYFFSFHMPLFFILAGITFSTKNDFTSFTWKKFKTLIIPYIFFAAIIIAVYSALSVTHAGSYVAFDQIKAFILQQRHTHLWFLPVLFISEILVYCVLCCIKGKKIPLLSTIVAILLTLHFCLRQSGCDNLIWNIDLVPLAAAFILIGYIYKIADKPLAFENNLWFTGLLLVISISVSTFNYLFYGPADMFTNRYGSYPLFIVGAIVSTYLLVLILKRFSLPQWLIYIGTYSLVYYGLHRIVIDFMFAIYAKVGIAFDGDSIIGVVLALINVAIVFLLLYPIVEFINKRTPWIIGKF